MRSVRCGVAYTTALVVTIVYSSESLADSSSCPLSPFIARLATSFNAASFSAPARLVLGLRTLRFATNITTDHLLARSAANPLVFLSVWMSARKCAMDSTSRAVAAPGLLYLHWG